MKPIKGNGTQNGLISLRIILIAAQNYGPAGPKSPGISRGDVARPNFRLNLRSHYHRAPWKVGPRMFHQQFMKEFFLFGGERGSLGYLPRVYGQNHGVKDLFHKLPRFIASIVCKKSNSFRWQGPGRSVMLQLCQRCLVNAFGGGLRIAPAPWSSINDICIISSIFLKTFETKIRMQHQS